MIESFSTRWPPVDYAKGQLATLVSSGKWPARAGTSAFVALAPDGLIVAVGAATSLFLYSAATGELLAQIDDIHTGNAFLPR